MRDPDVYVVNWPLYKLDPWDFRARFRTGMVYSEALRMRGY